MGALSLDGFDALLITAGAGMGVDSGLPDFRGDEGFWRAYPPFRKLGLSFVDLADPRWFRDDPALAWGFYGHRLGLYRRTVPHAGFARLRALGARMAHGLFVFTSNVDGQFQRAGFDPERIVECHGSLHHLQCTAACGLPLVDAAPWQVEVDEASFRAQGPLPVCPECGALLRPNVLMFGDGEWDGLRTTAQHRRFDRWLSTLRSAGARPLVIELGAGSAIPTVRRLGEEVVRRLPAGRLVRINPREAEVPAGQLGIAAGAVEGLARLLD